MQAKIKLQKAKTISGIGLVLQFVVLEGTIKPGMKTEFRGKTFTIGDRLIAFKSSSEAEKTFDPIGFKGCEYRFVPEAKKDDLVIQANLSHQPKNALDLLAENTEGILVFRGPDSNPLRK